MRYTKILKIVSIILLIVLIAGSVYARTGYDWETEDEETQVRPTGRRPTSSILGRITTYFIVMPLWLLLSWVLGMYWKNNGYNFWVGFCISLFGSPLLSYIILRVFGVTSINVKAEKAAFEILAKQGYVKDDYLTENQGFNTPFDNSSEKEPEKAEMVLVSGGKLRIGSLDDNLNEVTELSIETFYLGKHPVTQKLWFSVTGKNPAAFRGKELPVESVDWYEALTFCNLLSDKEGLKPVYSIEEVTEENSLGFRFAKKIVAVDKDADGYRLPTETEWEFAARGGVKSEDTLYAGSSQLHKVAWFDGNAGGQTQPVGSKQANEIGLYDMSGNVWEWCWEWYNEEISIDEKSNQESDKGKVIRGGSWNYGPVRCRVDHRFFRNPGNRNDDLGLRLARNFKSNDN